MHHFTSRFRMLSACSWLALSVSGSTAAAQTFTTIYNVPDDIFSTPIGSNTQINLMPEGRISMYITLGSSVGTENIEVNITGGWAAFFAAMYGSTINMYDGLIYEPLEAYNGSVINFHGGSLADGVLAESGSVFNIHGGTIGRDFQAMPGSTITMSGGEVGWAFDLRTTNHMLMSGGTLGRYATLYDGSWLENTGGLITGDYFAIQDGATYIQRGGASGDRVLVAAGGFAGFTGGNIGHGFSANADGVVRMIGGDFLLDGEPIPGLNSGQPSVPVNLPEGSVLTGVLSDGSVFAFTSHLEDALVDGSLELVPVAIPTTGQAVIHAPAEAIPKGLYGGQTLYLDSGALTDPYFTAVSSQIYLQGGELQTGATAVDSYVRIDSGTVGPGFSATAGSTVDINGGVVNKIVGEMHVKSLQVAGDSVLNLWSGRIDSDVQVAHGSTMNMSAGEVLGAIVLTADSTLNLSGGMITGQIIASDNSTIQAGAWQGNMLCTVEYDSELLISGASDSWLTFVARYNSHVDMLVTSCVIDGVDLAEGMFPGESLELAARDTRIDIVLADGTEVALYVNSEDPIFPIANYIDPDSSLTVTSLGVYGDLNDDGFIGLDDLDIILTAWNTAVSPGDPLAGDFSRDGFIGLDDLDIVLANWNLGIPPQQINIPEPASLFCLAALAGIVSQRRRF